VLLVSVAILFGASRAATPAASILAANVRLSSAFLLGSTLSAMLLGHHYLTAPAMSVEPLKRFVNCMIVALGLRTLTALPVVPGLLGIAASRDASDPLLLGMRWGIGLIATAVATALAERTVRIRSTQSATGILYIAMTFVLVGELTGMMLERDLTASSR
jgi:hypothetical protein